MSLHMPSRGWALSNMPEPWARAAGRFPSQVRDDRCSRCEILIEVGIALGGPRSWTVQTPEGVKWTVHFERVPEAQR